MNLNQKKAVILKASKKYSKRKIDVTGKGRNVLRLERGEGVSENKINEMYENVLRLEGPGHKKERKVISSQFSSDVSIDKKDVIGKILGKNGHSEIDELEKENSFLKLEIERLKDKITKLKEDNRALIVGNKLGKGLGNVLGFSLQMKEVGSGERRYKKLYASKMIDGKQKWVYIGNGNPEEKIRAWAEKKGILLEEH